MRTSICSPSMTGCRVRKVCSGWCGVLRLGVELAQREAESTLGDAVAAVSVGAVEGDRGAVGPLLDADEQPGIVGAGDRDLQSQGHRAAEFGVVVESVVEGGGVASQVEGDLAVVVLGCSLSAPSAAR